MQSIHLTVDALWSRMERAVEKVQERLRRAVTALEPAGLSMFLDGNAGKPREAVHLVFAGEQVHENELLPNPRWIGTHRSRISRRPIWTHWSA